uniref:Uncharacterized protein n=1 Tax=Noctiluca scintillans TaxID=2966 RepID=A0A7S1A9L7_NOCSC|mmetsp:Transcript_37442/g.99527  ORF Transcript_37442/g.99527 Transcript_37442/m.99527 type:complete len:170 (+) Transcript_37442:89-598(+)
MLRAVVVAWMHMVHGAHHASNLSLCEKTLDKFVGTPSDEALSLCLRFVAQGCEAARTVLGAQPLDTGMVAHVCEVLAAPTAARVSFLQQRAGAMSDPRVSFSVDASLNGKREKGEPPYLVKSTSATVGRVQKPQGSPDHIPLATVDNTMVGPPDANGNQHDVPVWRNPR